MIAIAETQSTLQSFNSDDASSGYECFFINYRNFGIKLYACEGEANRVASRQRTASKHGLGPEVLSEVIAYDIPDDLSKLIASGRPALGGSVLYGYETQVVEIRKNALEGVEELRMKFRERIGQVLYDSGGSNVGFRENGEMVCIDFGDCSFDNEF